MTSIISPEHSQCPSPMLSPSQSPAPGHKLGSSTAIDELTEAYAHECDTVMELLRRESSTSPIYLSRPSSALKKLATLTAPCEDVRSYWRNVEENLRTMDRINDASFTDWIRNEDNLSLSLPHLKRVMFDYSPERIVNGLRWLVLEWRLASIAAAIKYLFVDDLWAVASTAPTSTEEPSTRDYFQIGTVRYGIPAHEVRSRIYMIISLIDGWDYLHVKELFYFLCSVGCAKSEQAAFLCQALICAFPDASEHARTIKQHLITDFFG